MYDLLLSHFTDKPFKLVPDWPYFQDFRYKPSGLWLSDESDYGWKEWCTDNRFREANLAHETKFRIRPGANVLHLKNLDDIYDFDDKYAQNTASYVRSVDWKLVTDRYDGILLTPYRKDYERILIWHEAWDVSSGCFWNLECLEMVPSRKLQGL